MRNSYSIHHRTTVVELLTAAQQVLDAVNDGVLTSELAEPQITRAVTVTDRLAECVTSAYADMSINDTSPFARYRKEILGTYTTAERLQALTLHLWNYHNPVNVAALLINADEKHRRIALEMIASYAVWGENDPAFMLLADEIRDRHAQEAQREQELETA
ncbi:MAG: hypothetical protein PHQ05_05075 [Sterolibacterium sp.]|nr:hypothetical protein [Sterolibacterium sp.]